MAERLLGTYRYDNLGGTVERVAMQVTEELATWREAGVRRRARLPPR